MAFKKYTPPRKRPDRLIVTIRKKQIQFNKKCQEYLDGVDYVELYFDEKNKIIGIAPNLDESDDTIKNTSNDELIVSAQSVMEFEGSLEKFNSNEIFHSLFNNSPDGIIVVIVKVLLFHAIQLRQK